MPITGPLRAVDTKVLGISLETTVNYGSALDRHVVVSADAGDGHDIGTVDFIENSAGTVVRTDIGSVTPDFLTSVDRDHRSFDALVINVAASPANAGTAISNVAANAAPSIEAALGAGARVIFSIHNLPA